MHPSIRDFKYRVVVCLREAGCYREKVMDLESYLGSEHQLLCDLRQVSGPLSTLVS